MTSAVSIELIDKDSETVRLPTIDFLDRKSLQMWLEARKLIFKIGERF